MTPCHASRSTPPTIRTLADLLIAIYFLVSLDLAVGPVIAERHIRRMYRITFELASLLGPSPSDIVVETLFALDIACTARKLFPRASPSVPQETMVDLEHLVDHAQAFRREERPSWSFAFGAKDGGAKHGVRILPPEIGDLLSAYLERKRVDPDPSADDHGSAQEDPA